MYLSTVWQIIGENGQPKGRQLNPYTWPSISTRKVPLKCSGNHKEQKA